MHHAQAHVASLLFTVQRTCLDKNFSRELMKFNNKNITNLLLVWNVSRFCVCFCFSRSLMWKLVISFFYCFHFRSPIPYAYTANSCFDKCKRKHILFVLFHIRLCIFIIFSFVHTYRFAYVCLSLQIYMSNVGWCKGERAV